MRKSQNNFTAGEWSPFLDGRSDLEKYGNACLKLTNFRPLPWGGATYRQGTLLAGLAKTPTIHVRLIPFNYSTSVSYVIELGNQYMRFWNSNGTPVTVAAHSAVAPNFVLSTTYPPGAFVTDTLNSLVYYTVGGVVNAPQTPSTYVSGSPWVLQSQFELISPYTATFTNDPSGADQIFAVQYKQINAQMRITHPLLAPQTLTYGGSATAWTIAATAFKYPPLLNQNAVQANTLSVGATTGSTTLTSSTAGTFVAGHVGSYWEIQHLRVSASTVLSLNTAGTATSANIAIQGDWTFSTSQFWDGVVQVQRSIDAGATWTTIREFTAKCDQNYSTSGTETAPAIGFPVILYRIRYVQNAAPFTAGNWVGSAPSQYSPAQASLESQDAYIAGLLLVTGFTDSQHVTVSTIISPASTATTYLWSEGAFSTVRGFPQSVAFYEQRMLYSGTTFLPNNVWGSVTSDFDNFQFSDNDDGAVSFQPAVCQQNQTAWLATLLRVHVGTSGEEIVMASGNLDEALTPSNITMRAQSYYGSAPIQPLLLQNSILFIERNGQRVREMRELSPYVVPTDFIAPDLTLMAEHIVQPGIIQMDFGRLPDPLGYFVRSDGGLAVMTYNREQNINAWALYQTAGQYESVASIYGKPADSVWVSVFRILNGAAVRTIEVFTVDPASFPNESTNMMLDCGTQVTVTPGATSISGLTAYSNTVVTLVIDGAEYAGLTVSGGGVLTFPPNVIAGVNCTANIGLPYVGYLIPMKPVLQDQEGPSQGRRLRVSEVELRVRNSLSVQFAGVPAASIFPILTSSFQEYAFRAPNDTVGMNTSLTGFDPNGTKYDPSTSNGVADFALPGPWPDGNNFSGQISLQQKHPWPLTILGIFYKLEAF